MAGHSYPGAPGYNPEDPGDCFTSDCAWGCGCWAGPSRSGGPKDLDPFGECPNAPADGLPSPLSVYERIALEVGQGDVPQ